MNKLIKNSLIPFLIFSSLSAFVCAELKELDDKKLDEQKGQAGITIDMAFKLTIGEFAFLDTNDKDPRKLGKNGVPEAPPRIEYVLQQNGR